MYIVHVTTYQHAMFLPCCSIEPGVEVEVTIADV